jgi:predicted ribosome quality control (RQC) complex YloA/Tae2 family protein
VVLLEDDEAEASSAAVAVNISLDKTAQANARDLFQGMKVAKKKRSKTEEAAAKVIDLAEKQSAQDLAKQTVKRQLKSVRKPYWCVSAQPSLFARPCDSRSNRNGFRFEKFYWFITSENYLVLAGRDAQQNEQLVKRYLRPGDAYIHADIHGASSCILLNKDPKGLAPLSPIALHEAGCMTVCRSAAWTSKVQVSAWWVNADQVLRAAVLSAANPTPPRKRRTHT